MKKFEMKFGNRVFVGHEYEPAPISMTEPPVLPSADPPYVHPADHVVMTPVDLMNPNVVILPDANGGSTIVQDFELAHPVILGPNTDDDVPGCALSEDDLDAETLKQLEGAGHIKVYPNRIQVVGAPRPVDTMIARFGSTFRVLDRVMPKRVLDEEFGDALEAMQRVANDPRHRFPRIVIGL